MKKTMLMGFILIIVVVLGGLRFLNVKPAQSVGLAEDGVPAATAVVRIYYNDPADFELLKGFDLFEVNNWEEQYVLAAVNAAELATLKTIGFRVEVDGRATADFNRRPEPLLNQVSGIPGYPCYRTVEETFVTAETIVADYPNLANWIDIGDSWEKITPGGLPGYDLMALQLTNQTFPGPKPAIFILSAIHAREYAPAELNTRLAEYLVTQYGSDADVTWLLDYHEVHLLLQANPDGRKQAETGLSWRKNTNENYCSPTSINRGADLNRNFEFLWGCCGGSSASECSSTFRGSGPASEPEVQAIQSYSRAIFPDQREDDLDAPAPVDASGVFIDIHSFSELVLWPWGWGSDLAPNSSALQTLGRKMAYFNAYAPGQAISLYPTDGATDDFAYGDLGVAAYTFEVGTSFFQSCEVFENEILPQNLPALLYAAKSARAPYLLPAGPDAVDLSLSATAVSAGTTVELSALIDDTRFNNSNGSEPTQVIAAAEYMLDAPYWDTDNNPAAFPMTAEDGAFDAEQETAVAVIDTSGWELGQHILFVRGQDSDGNWGVVSAIFLYIIDPDTAPIIQGNVTDLNSGAPVLATIRTASGLYETTSDPLTGFYKLQVLSGAYDLIVEAEGYETQTVSDVSVQDYDLVTLDFELQPIVCGVFTSVDVPKTIPETTEATIFSALPIAESGNIVDVNVVDLQGTHTWFSDLTFTLRSAEGTAVEIMSPSCGNSQDFDLNLDDDAQPGMWPCPPTDAGVYRPSEPLSLLDGENMQGTWLLEIHDRFPQDGGQLENWGLEICTYAQNAYVQRVWLPFLGAPAQ